MTRTLLKAIGITAVAAGLLAAQGPRMGRGMGTQQAEPGAMAANRVARLAIFLDLTENQKTAALNIFQANCDNSEQRQADSAALREKWQAAIQNGDEAAIETLSKEWAAMMAQRRADSARAHANFLRLLTPEQLEKYQAMNGAGMGMKGNRGGRQGGGGRSMGCMRTGTQTQQPAA